MPNQKGNRYKISIRIIQKPDDYQPEPHQSLDDLPPLDTDGQIRRR